MNDLICQIRPIIEFLYFVGGIGLCVMALIAYRFTKKTLSINSKRDSIKVAVEQNEYYLKNIVPLHLKLNKIIEENNIQYFNGWNVIIKSGNIIVENNGIIKKDNLEVIADCCIDTLDAMEAFSVYFISGLADEEVAYSSVSSSYIAVIEKLLPLFKEFIKCGHYRNILKLFWLWKSRNNYNILLSKQEENSIEIEETLNKIIIPIGV